METVPTGFDLKTMMTLGFYLLAALYVIFSVVFYYHWTEYALDVRIRRLSITLYLLTTLPLIGLVGLMLLI